MSIHLPPRSSCPASGSRVAALDEGRRGALRRGRTSDETRRNDTMRFLITAGAAPEGPSGVKCEGGADMNLFDALMRFNEEMERAGVLIASEGHSQSVRQARVVVRNGKRVVSDGPFTEAKELVGGFYLIDVPTIEEAIRWMLKCPVGMAADEVLHIYPLTKAEDLPEELRQ